MKRHASARVYLPTRGFFIGLSPCDPDQFERGTMNEKRTESESTSMLTRRQALVLLGAAGAATAEGCGITVPGGSTNGSCTQTPALTEGPYFVDELLNRS